MIPKKAESANAVLVTNTKYAQLLAKSANTRLMLII